MVQPRNTAYNWRPEAFDSSLGASISIDPNNGYLVQKSSGAPIPLARTGSYSLSSLDPAIVNGLTQCGVNGLPNSCMTNKLFRPSPRFGFSWDPWGNGKTAIRAGYGLFWEHGTGYEANVGSLIGSAPLVLSETQSNIGGSTPLNSIGFSCQGGPAQCSNASAVTNGATFPLNVTSIPRTAVYPYIQQWSLSVQREVGKAAGGPTRLRRHKGNSPDGCPGSESASAFEQWLEPLRRRPAHHLECLPEWGNRGRFFCGGAQQ